MGSGPSLRPSGTGDTDDAPISSRLRRLEERPGPAVESEEMRHVDVIIEQWQKLTGKQATLDGEGATFHEVRLGRRQ